MMPKPIEDALIKIGNSTGKQGSSFALDKLWREYCKTMNKPTIEQKAEILVRCIPCHLNDIDTRYPRGRDCPRCGKSNDRGYTRGVVGCKE